MSTHPLAYQSFMTSKGRWRFIAFWLVVFGLLWLAVAGLKLGAIYMAAVIAPKYLLLTASVAATHFADAAAKAFSRIVKPLLIFDAVVLAGVAYERFKSANTPDDWADLGMAAIMALGAYAEWAAIPLSIIIFAILYRILVKKSLMK